MAWALGNFGAIAYFRDEPEVGVTWLEESVSLGRRAGYDPFLSLALAEVAEARYAIGHALMTLGDLNWRRGETDRAVELWQRGLVVRAHIADRRGIADALDRLA